MYALLRTLPAPQLLKQQLPVFLTAFIIAELFYKFHSFTLECLAFLGTWLALDALLTLIWPVSQQPQQSVADD